MFIVRLAGDVDGEKRNVEVVFATRPSLQLLCTVAEMVLPLRGHRVRPPWHPTWAAPSTTGAAADGVPPADTAAAIGNGALVPVEGAESGPLPTPTPVFTVDTLVCLDRATRAWTPLYSASQISTGAQVYCFPPLQHRRVVLVKRGPCAVAGAAVAEGGDGDGPRRAPSSAGHAHVGVPVIVGWRDERVDTDRPGAIPPPQHRLVWDDAANRSARGRVTTPVQVSSAASVVPGAVRGAEPDSVSSFLHTPEGSRGLRHPFASFSTTHSSSPSPLHTSAAAASASAPGRLGAAGAPGPHPRAVAGLVRSLSPPHQQALHDERSGAGHPMPETGASLQFATAHALPPPPPPPIQRRSADAAPREESLLLAHVPPAWSALLQGGGDGGERYTHLGERATLVFDVLLRLDAQEAAMASCAIGAGARRHLLLRDFYLLASYLADATLAGRALFAGGGAAAAAAPVTDVTAQLHAQFQWTWDDLVRHADRDRDGCISFQEWISFGIEHPAVMLLLGRAVHAVLLREAFRTRRRRSGTRSRSQDTAAEPLLLAPPPHPSPPSSAAGAASASRAALPAGDSGSSSGSHLQHPARPRYPRPHSSLHVECSAAEEEPGSDAMYPCRVHRQPPAQDGVQPATVVGALDHNRVRCDACRELLSQAPASLCYRRDVAQPHRFPETLRR